MITLCDREQRYPHLTDVEIEVRSSPKANQPARVGNELAPTNRTSEPGSPPLTVWTMGLTETPGKASARRCLNTEMRLNQPCKSWQRMF